MPQIPEQDRLTVVDAHLAHYEQADLQNGAPIMLAENYGRTQLAAQRAQYHAKQEQIEGLEGDLKDARSLRDTTFGVKPEDETGAWFWLKLYKPTVTGRLGPRHAMTRTVPNLGRIKPQTYLEILHRFINHWKSVNAALASEMTLEDYTLAKLQQAHDLIMSLMEKIDKLDITLLPLAREEREQLFGDEEENERDENSIVAWLLRYHVKINAKYPNKPLAASLPEIFPVGGPRLPTFRFRWTQQPGGVVRTWLENPGLPAAAHVFLKEGAAEQTQPLNANGNLVLNTWTDLTVIDDLDRLELRDTAGRTVARGVFDATLPEPS